MIKGYRFHRSTFEGIITKECSLYMYTVVELFSFVSSLTCVSLSFFTFFFFYNFVLLFQVLCSTAIVSISQQLPNTLHQIQETQQGIKTAISVTQCSKV